MRASPPRNLHAQDFLQSCEGLFFLCTEGDPIIGNPLSVGEAPRVCRTGAVQLADSMKRA